jgi:hypothetical protein
MSVKLPGFDDTNMKVCKVLPWGLKVRSIYGVLRQIEAIHFLNFVTSELITNVSETLWIQICIQLNAQIDVTRACPTSLHRYIC